MAIRIPLVIVDGEIQQLQSGDNIGEVELLSRTFTSTAVKCEAVYADAAGSVGLAQANAAGTSKPIGLATEGVTAASSGYVQSSGVLTATTGEWDAVTGETGGLTANAKYYLDDANAGNLLQDDNLSSLGTGDYVVEIGTGLSTTEMLISIEKRILL